jgi:hypothetical protein
MTESISFYLDEHVAHAVARGLSSREVNVLTAASAGMLESSDVEHLTFATVEGRVLFSQDADFLRLHAAGHEHAGIVHSPQQTSIGTIVVGLMLIFEVMSPEEMENHLEFL